MSEEFKVQFNAVEPPYGSAEWREWMATGKRPVYGRQTPREVIARSPAFDGDSPKPTSRTLSGPFWAQ